MDIELPGLSLADVREWTGERSYQLGRQYFRDGAHSRLRRDGLTLKGHCQGTASQPYRVEVTLGRAGIARAHCSCPVGEEGRCKHVGALLVAWLEATEDFVEVAALDATLGRLQPPELLALVRRLLRRFPDAEEWLELELPILLGGPAAEAPVDARDIRRQVKVILQSGGGYPERWDGSDTMADVGGDLEPLLDHAHDYLARGAYRNALTVYLTLAATALDEYDVEEDWEGELAAGVGAVVARCMEGVGDCLRHMTEPSEREAALRALFELSQHENEGYGYDAEGTMRRIVLEHATPEERRMVAGLVRAALPAGQDWLDQYHRREMGVFLLELEADTLDDEAYLRICRETGQTERMVERLLMLGRWQDAVAELRQTEDVRLLVTLADLLRQRGHGDMAEQVVRQRSRKERDDRLTEWLLERAREAGDTDEALALAETLFWRGPSVHAYRRVRELATAEGTWEKVRPGIFDHLTHDGRFALLTELHLLEGEVDQALATLGRVKVNGSWSNDGFALRVAVAEAAERTRPEEAIRLYLEEAEPLIEAQGRERYATAAEYLLRVRRLHTALGREADWGRLIADTRERHCRKRALLDELQKAGV